MESLTPYPKTCSHHNGAPLILICLDKKCEDEMLCCVSCIDEKHKRHEIISLRKF